MDPTDSDMSVDPPRPSGSSAYDLSREPEIVPRVGDEFQAEFPQMVSRSEYLSLGQSGSSESSVGVSVPALLPSRDHRSEKGGKAKAKASNLSRKERAEFRPNLVPLSEPAVWTDMEKLSFLVGLYIFQKNFVQLAEFIETRSMGDVMAYYYGSFYHSQEYSRWSDTRKLRSRRCIHGHKIFTGARQQEFVARLFNNVSEDCKTSLIEVSRSFSEGKIPLQQYISSMKGLVGLKLLVEAVGLGKGRQDLTGVTFEPSRASQSIQIRPEIPTGKACANLTPSQITGYLTGDYRKSKLKLGDLFYESVWPRLLARGWISEEPRDPGYPVAVHTKPFVFLVPGVSSIARRRLVKGIHFYDSITDVLGKVAKDPSIILLDSERGDESMINNEGISDIMEEDDVPTRSRRCYLQPRTTTRTTTRTMPGMRFTIVDASSDGEKVHMLKELKNPQESTKPYHAKFVQVSDEDAPKAAVKADFSKKRVKHEGVSQTMVNLVNGALDSKKRGIQIAEDTPQPVNKAPRTEILEEKQPVNESPRVEILEEKKQQKKAARKRPLSQSTKDLKCRLNKQARRLTGCNKVETTSSFSEKPDDAFPVQSEGMDTSSSEQNAPTQALSPIKAYLSEAEDISEPSSSSHTSHGSQNQPLIDLNIPQVPMDDENDVLMEDAEGRKDKEEAGINLTVEVKIEPVSDQQSQQRRGTRNRPPTSRALEALASGFLTVNSRGKGGSGGPRSRSTPRPSRQARGIARLGIGKTPLAPIPEESKTPSASSKGGQSAAGSDPDKAAPGEFEVLSAPASEN